MAETLKAESELRGAEPVSPHYEHFSFARRQALIFLGGLGVLRFIASTEDFFMFAQSATWAWTFYFAYSYFWLEGKKYFLLPFLTRFYRKLLNLELSNVETYWAENTEVRIRNLMSTAKEQIEYKSVHGDYLSIRNNTLLNFLISEQLALKNHLHARAESILREAETLEAINQNKIINSVMQETLQSIDIAYKENKAKIEADIFELALEGIAQGKMDYAKDPILPFVLQTINRTVEKFSKISPEEQDKLVSLTEEQLTALRNADARARDEYILTEPKIDGSLRNNPTVAKILQTWGK